MNAPTLDQRLDACRRPVGRQHVMYQRWRDLLFLHWEFDPQVLQETLPEGLTVDTYQGRAFLGVVPFFMQGIRPRFCPPVPGVSDFLEINLRTYVHDRTSRPGVWFYSLDANQWLAVRVARTFFNLPYFDATIQAEKMEAITYSVSRKGCEERFDSCFRYAEKDELAQPDPESLEYFLVERYFLFAVNGAGTLFSGKVSHTPYPVGAVDYEVVREGTIALAGFESPGRAPDHAMMSRGVDVEIFATETV